MKISVQEFESQAFQTKPWYQGCAQEIVINPGTNGAYDFAQLKALEQSGKWVAEPKGDGNWAAIFHGANSLNHYSRTCKSKGIPEEFYNRLPEGTLVVGEAMRGSQFSIAMCQHYGHDIFLLWDILYLNYEPVKDLPAAERRKLLENLVETTDFGGRLKVLPRYTKDFSQEYLDQHEGLVLKPADEGPYVGNGVKVGYWIKVKKWFESDAIVLGYNKSGCRGSQAGLDLPANIIVGLYGTHSDKECRKSFASLENSELYIGAKFADLKIPQIIERDGQQLRLFVASAVNCGDYELGDKMVKEFDALQYTVMKVHHFGQFEGGSFRHPNPHGGVLALRDDKNPEDCVFTGMKYKILEV